MLTDWLPDFTTQQWVVLMFAALLVGISKTGVPGISIINIPLLADNFDAKLSTGLLLPMLAITDIFAVLYYKRHAQWKHVCRLLPWGVSGIILGSIIIRCIDNSQLAPLIGGIVLVLLGVNYYRQHHPTLSEKIPTHWAFAAIMGFSAGVTTQLANAAGPIMIIYLLSMKLDKDQFIGTGAWYFLILNWLKIPIFMSEGRISWEGIKVDLVMIPILATGAILGILILKKIPQKWFNVIIQVLAVGACIKLIFKDSNPPEPVISK